MYIPQAQQRDVASPQKATGIFTKVFYEGIKIAASEIGLLAVKQIVTSYAPIPTTDVIKAVHIGLNVLQLLSLSKYICKLTLNREQSMTELLQDSVSSISWCIQAERLKQIVPM